MAPSLLGAISFSVTGISPASQFEAQAYPATLAAGQDPADELSVDVEGGSLSCESVSAAGTLSAAATSLALTPSFSGCQALGFAGATVAVNGCSFAFELTDTSWDSYPATLELVCPEGQALEVVAATCKMTISSQSGLGSVQAATDSEASPQRLELDLDVSGLEYTKVTDGFLCPFSGTGAEDDGAITGGLLVEAADSGETAVGVRVGG